METEITVELLENLEIAKNKLNNLGFIIKEKVLMTDYYFSKLPLDEILNLDYANLIKNSFLVRSVKTDNEEINQIIFKKKILDNCNNVIAEDKIKTNISNLNSTVKLFSEAGLTNYTTLTQNMTVYSNGEMEFVIQEIDNLGVFIEYEEDDTMKGLTEQEKINTMLNNLKSLRLEIGNDYSCKKVYLKLHNNK